MEPTYSNKENEKEDMNLANRGAPPKYKTPEEMQEKIDTYFAECKGEIIYDAYGNPMIDKNGNVVREGSVPPTMTGLALALGFATRKSLLDYQAKPDFVYPVTRAKSMIERYTEQRLFDREGVQGAKFSLSNNFEGWSEKQELKTEGTVIKIINDIPKTESADKK